MKKIEDIWGFLVSKWVAGSCEQDKDINFQFKSKTMKDSAIKGPLEYVAFRDFYLILHFWKLRHLFQMRRNCKQITARYYPQETFTFFTGSVTGIFMVNSQGSDCDDRRGRIWGMYFQTTGYVVRIMSSTILSLGEFGRTRWGQFCIVLMVVTYAQLMVW